jgi:frataxin-like iron-binding protein CyaY
VHGDGFDALADKHIVEKREPENNFWFSSKIVGKK